MLDRGPRPVRRHLTAVSFVTSLLANTAIPGVASAQETATSRTETAAKTRFAEGAEAYQAGDYEAARIAFAQAYAIEPLPIMLLNLGHAELKTGRHVDAARHLSQALREAEIGTLERRKAEASLQEAEAQIGRVSVSVNVDGAAVTINNDSIGSSPLLYLWHVEAGEHRARATKAGYEPAEEVFGLSKGQSKRIELQLVPLNGPAGPPETSPLTPPPDEPVPGPRILPLAIGGGIALLGLGTGIVLAVSAAGSRSDRDTTLENLRERTGERNPCAPEQRADNTAACGTIASFDDSASTQQGISVIGFAVGGIAAAGTLTYLLWPRASAPTRTESSWFVAPEIGPGGAGIRASGHF